MNTTATLLPQLVDFATVRHDSHVLTVILAGAVVSFASLFLLRSSSDGHVFDLGGFPITTAWTFFSKRHEFMVSNSKKAGGLPFRFRVLQHRVVAVSGSSARKSFYSNPSLDFQEGYKILMGGAPQMDDISIEHDVVENVSDLVKRLNFLLRKDRIADLIPVFLDDINRRMSEWGTEGTINPFKEVYELVFQMTVRMASCDELAQDPKTLERMANIFWDIEKSSTPTRLLLPWLPSPSQILSKISTARLYFLFLKAVRDRRAAGADANDAIDILIRNGDTDNDIVKLIIAIIFAGFVNTGVNSCWALLYLGTHPQWRAKAVEQLKAVISKHTTPSSAGESFHKLLSTIPLDAWENELAALDLIIRETIRLSLTTTALRRNVGKNITMQDTSIKKGDFLAYSVADAHLNPEIYTDPEEFNPGRFEEGREEDKKVHFGFLGFGAGRHPCGGMRIAKLEIKLTLAMLLLGYDYQLVDGQGLATNVIPKPDRNDIQQARPLGDPVYLKFERIRA